MASIIIKPKSLTNLRLKQWLKWDDKDYNAIQVTSGVNFKYSVWLTFRYISVLYPQIRRGTLRYKPAVNQAVTRRTMQTANCLGEIISSPKLG